MTTAWLVLTAIVVTVAQPAMPDSAIRHVCKDDTLKFCPEMRDPVKIVACLEEHEQDVSEECAAGLHRCPMYNCMDDIKKFCPNSTTTKDTLRCLWNRRSELSDKCWNQSVGSTKLGFLPETHACREDEQKFCANEESLLGAMSCLRQQLALSPPCSRIVENCRLFACVPEAQQSCPDITSLGEMKGCIMQHSLKCSPKREVGEVSVTDTSPFPLCQLETANLCQNVPPEGIYDCLHGHEDSLSKQCKKTLKSSLEHRCKEERISFCLDHFGQGLVDCLSTVKPISSKCQRALSSSVEERSANRGVRLDKKVDADQLKDNTMLNILLTGLASVAFIVMLVSVAYIVRKSRSGSIPSDFLPSTTTTTEYIRI